MRRLLSRALGFDDRKSHAIGAERCRKFGATRSRRARRMAVSVASGESFPDDIGLKLVTGLEVLGEQREDLMDVA